MNDVLVIGLSHKTAPIETRERFRVDSVEQALSERSEFSTSMANPGTQMLHRPFHR